MSHMGGRPHEQLVSKFPIGLHPPNSLPVRCPKRLVHCHSKGLKRLVHLYRKNVNQHHTPTSPPVPAVLTSGNAKAPEAVLLRQT